MSLRHMQGFTGCIKKQPAMLQCWAMLASWGWPPTTKLLDTVLCIRQSQRLLAILGILVTSSTSCQVFKVKWCYSRAQQGTCWSVLLHPNHSVAARRRSCGCLTWCCSRSSRTLSASDSCSRAYINNICDRSCYSGSTGIFVQKSSLINPLLNHTQSIDWSKAWHSPSVCALEDKPLIAALHLSLEVSVAAAGPSSTRRIPMGLTGAPVA